MVFNLNNLGIALQGNLLPQLPPMLPPREELIRPIQEGFLAADIVRIFNAIHE